MKNNLSKNTIKIDFIDNSPIVSHLIYGQFIEHLGNCIYNGIWAEMLQDRKFYYNPGSNDSPWSLLNNDTQCEQFALTENGKMFVKIGSASAICGIFQNRITLSAGRKYKLRICAKGNQVKIAVKYDDGTISFQNKLSFNSNIFTSETIEFISEKSATNARIVVSSNDNEIFLCAASIMPADNINGCRQDTMEVLRKLNSPVYRWPGGNFVSGYNWRDGIGDPDFRPTRKNPAWNGIEPNDFGLNEFITFCNELNAQPLIVVNTGLGKYETSVEQVRYCNDSPDTVMGKLREVNGSKEPFNVKLWGIGNEIYGNWQLGHSTVEQYCTKHNEFVKNMRLADAGIKCIAVGEVGNWSETMLKNCSFQMEFISEHLYYPQPQVRANYKEESLKAHVDGLKLQLRNIVEKHRNYRKNIPSLLKNDIKLAIDEWGYWYGSDVYGQLGIVYHYKDSIGVAVCLNEMIRNCDIIHLANYAQAVNVLGCIKTNSTKAWPCAVAVPLMLYRKSMFENLVQVKCDNPDLDIVATANNDRSYLSIAVVNLSEKNAELNLQISGMKISQNLRREYIACNDINLFNGPEKSDNINIKSQIINSEKYVNIEPFSISVILWGIK